MITPAKPKRRLSLQIIRVARELEALHFLGEASAATIALAIAKLPPKPVCERTILRDLQSLEFAGFVARRAITFWTSNGNGSIKVACDLWRLSEPVELRSRLGLVKGLSQKQLSLLKKGKPIAT
jgi:hypothetical protein